MEFNNNDRLFDEGILMNFFAIILKENASNWSNSLGKEMFSSFENFIQALCTCWDCVPKQCLPIIQNIGKFLDEQRLSEQGLGPTLKDVETNLEVVFNLYFKGEAPRFNFE